MINLDVGKVSRDWGFRAFVLLAGVGLSFLVAFLAYDAQWKKTQQSFYYLAKENYTAIADNLKWHRETLQNIGSLYLASKTVDADEFATFTAQSFSDHNSFDVLGWVAFDKQAGSFVWGQIKPDAHKAHKGSRIKEGTTLHEMIVRAKSTGEDVNIIHTLEDVLFTDIHRAYGGDKEEHLFIFHPVYKKKNNQSGAISQDDLIGLSFSVLDIEFLIKETAEDADLSIYNIRIACTSCAEDQRELYRAGEIDAGDAPYKFSRTMSLSDEKILIEFTPTKAFIAKSETYNAYIIFISFLALTIAALYLQQMKSTTISLEAAKKEAERTNSLKSDFLTTMSHEIRTPMNGILGLAELALGANPSPQVEGYMRTIINSSESLMSIIDDILDFSKIEAGKMEIDPMPVDMLELVDDVATLYSVKAQDKAVELAVRYVPGSERFVFVDPVRIRQIISNLVDNAIKFTDKGHIAITVEENKDAKTAPDVVELKFSVSDTGIGLPEETQQRIFEKFSQADNSTTRKYGGTGLGLSICKSLIEMMGGVIGVESRAGLGTTFWFTLPLVRNEIHITSKSCPQILKNLRVLVVDDFFVVRKLVKEQLCDVGIRCEAADSGEDALIKIEKAAAEKDPYQIIIIDYLMPGMNGEMLACAINDHEILRESCLIMLTAAGSPLADDSFVEKGFSAYIPKPVRGETFIKSLAGVWGKYKEGWRDVLIPVDVGLSGQHRNEDYNPKIKGTKILVAEDNLVNQVFIREVLEEMQARCMVVTDGEQAVSAVLKDKYDLIIMDCLMPLMDGFEASRQICQMKAAGQVDPDLAILALTANAMKGDRQKCLDAGMDDYLAKPVRHRELKEKIISLIGIEQNSDDAAQDTQSLPPDNPPEKTQARVISLADVAGHGAPDDVLDMEAVGNARSILKGKYDEMLDVYIENCKERVAEIERAVACRDIQSVIRPAHTLKSTSKQMGATKLGEMAKEVEHFAKAMQAGKEVSDQDCKTILAAMDDINEMLSATSKAFDRMQA